MIADILKNWDFLVLALCCSMLGKLLDMSALTALVRGRWSYGLVAVVSGILPVPGRVLVAAPVLASCSPTNRDLGLFNYVSTHSYYLWSPLESSVIIILAGLGLSYAQFLSVVWPMLVVYFGFWLWLLTSLPPPSPPIAKTAPDWRCWVQLGAVVTGIGLALVIGAPTAFVGVLVVIVIVGRPSWRELLVAGVGSLPLLAVVAAAIVLGAIARHYSAWFLQFLATLPTTTSILTCGFVAAWLLGSSTRYAGITVAIVGLLGMPLLGFVFALEFCAYLLSPTHKCLLASCYFFNSQVTTTYWYLALLCALLLSASLLALWR